MGASSLEVRRLTAADAPAVLEAFRGSALDPTVKRFQYYLAEQSSGARSVFIAHFDGRVAGVGSVNWSPTYPPFERNHIPEIQDLSVVPSFQRRGIGNALLDTCEGAAAERSAIVGIAVGLYAAYAAALRVYIKRGYVPDGAGVWYVDHHPERGAKVRLDDDLVLHFTKQLR
jgi:GNAT superfamily N-acetyltransferase